MTRNSCPLFKPKLQASAQKVDFTTSLIAFAHSVATLYHLPHFLLPVPSVGTLCIGHGGTLLTRAAEAHALALKNFRNVLSSSNTSILIGHKLLSPEIVSTKG